MNDDMECETKLVSMSRELAEKALRNPTQYVSAKIRKENIKNLAEQMRETQRIMDEDRRNMEGRGDE